MEDFTMVTARMVPERGVVGDCKGRRAIEKEGKKIIYDLMWTLSWYVNH